MAFKEVPLKDIDTNITEPQKKLYKILQPLSNYDDYERQFRKCQMTKVKSLDSFVRINDKQRNHINNWVKEVKQQIIKKKQRYQKASNQKTLKPVKQKKEKIEPFLIDQVQYLQKIWERKYNKIFDNSAFETLSQQATYLRRTLLH